MAGVTELCSARVKYLSVLFFISVGLIWTSVSSAEAVAQTLDRVAATKMVHIGYIADQAPFAWLGADGVPTGYAIDLCTRVVQKIAQTAPGLTTGYVQTSIADGLRGIETGRIDLLCGAITITLGRRETVDFSQPIFMTGAAALLRRDSPRDLRELFFGKHEISPPRSPSLHPFALSRVGVRAGTTTETVLRRAVTDGKYSTTVVGFTSHAEGIAALESRDIDAYFADRALLIELLGHAQDPSALIVGTRLFTREAYGIAMRRGDSSLRLLVDRVLSEAFTVPEFGTLLRKYFGAEATDLQAQIKGQSLPE